MSLTLQKSEVLSRPAASIARRGFNAVFWIVAYLFLAVFPLLVLLVGQVPKGGGFWWDFAMALGFGGLALMGLQSVLTARFRRATAPFGVDIIYYFHRLAAIGAFGLLVVHYLILRLWYGASLGPLNPVSASWHMTAGRVALVLFGALVVSSVGRKVFRIEYDGWRIGHAVMAVAAVVLAIIHIQGVGHYTRAPWKGTVWISYSVLWLLVLGYIRILKPLRLRQHPYRVVDVREERGNSWTLTLEPERGTPLDFRPGQFAWLSLGRSPFRAKEHPFSFSGSAADPKALRFTIKELGDFTRTIKSVKRGERAYVDGPHGVFTTDFHPHAPGFVFIAGGVGIAPIMSMLRTLADRADPRPFHLVYGSWRWDGVLFREEIETLKARLNLHVVHVLQEPPPEGSGESGFVTEAVLRRTVPFASEGFVYFLCGPKAMTEFVVPSLRRLNVPLRRIHFEHFEMV
jgi:predicted ferric reductase